MSLISPVSEVNDVYVFGDSHWRVFFPFVNHGDASANVSHTGERRGIKVRTIDTIANELSGSTMWGLLNDKSRHGARSRILNTINGLGGVDSIGLVFGEVDARYHYEKYYVGNQILISRIIDLVSRYVKFVQEDLIIPGLVRKNIFIYHGFAYPQRGNTLLQPGQPIGKDVIKAENVNGFVQSLIHACFMNISEVKIIIPNRYVDDFVSADGVHLEPDKIYNQFVLPSMVDRFLEQDCEIPF